MTKLSRQMRSAASVLLRAACLLRTDAVVRSWTTLDGTLIQSRASDLALSGLIRRAYDDLHGNQVRVEEGRASAVAWALALISQSPIDRSPDADDLVTAAHRLRDFAEYEEFLHEIDAMSATVKFKKEVAA